MPNSPSRAAAPPPPYERWFCTLLLFCIIALADPYFGSRRDSHLYSPEIGTFVETDHGLAPTAEHIWIDGRTAALLDSRSWIWFGLGFVFLQVLFYMLQCWQSARRECRSSQLSHAHRQPNA